MYILKNNPNILKPEFLVKHLNIRKATLADLDEIYHIACTVGTSVKDPDQGFLIDDYISNPKYYMNFIKDRIDSLDHFYVAEYDKIYGFLIAYTKDQWLSHNPNWINDVQWRPDFEKNYLDNFIVVDKTAISSELTGHGIGSLLYKKLLADLQREKTNHIFAETLISPKPNFASLNFRIKQSYEHVGISYYTYMNNSYTDLVYHKLVPVS